MLIKKNIIYIFEAYNLVLFECISLRDEIQIIVVLRKRGPNWLITALIYGLVTVK